MDETELEEGEACSYHGNRDDDDGYDSSVDPDVALSYIGERIQDVLGHFQKDFEGGVSAENLGAKFGGYGSFLPTYQRSPASYRSPSKVQQNDAPKPSSTFQLERGHHNFVVPVSCSQRARHLTACTTATPTPSLKDLIKKEGSVPPICAEDFARYESANLSNQKMMKLRLKVGSDKPSTQKRAAIYNGLGLGVSPSSTLEESHSGSDGMLHEHQDAPSESPTSILQMMTSFPVLGDLLLSPLPDNLLNLTKTENTREDRKSVIVSGLGAHGSNYMKDIRKVSRGKKVKSLERNDLSTASGSGNRKSSRNSNAVIGGKQLDTDTAYEEMVSRTLQLPLLSNVDKPLDDMTRGTDEIFGRSSEGSESLQREKRSDDLMNEETLNPKLVQSSVFEKPEMEDIEGIPVSDCFVQVKEDKGEQTNGIKATSRKQDHLHMLPEKEKPSSSRKKKLKAGRSQDTLAIDVSEGHLSGVSSKKRSMKSIREGDSNCKIELGEFKADKKFQSGRNKYTDFFGDPEFEEDQPGMVRQDTGTVKRSKPVPDRELRGRSEGGITGKLSKTQAHLDAAPEVVPGSAISMFGAAHPAALPRSEEDKWAYCDKCHRQRLFPPGTNPENLPDKWVCSMLDWLPPGMNSCSISQEESTNAVRAMGRATSRDARNHMNGNACLSNKVSSSPHFDAMHTLQTLPEEVHKNSPAEVSHPMKKNMQISAETRRLNDANPSSLEGQDDLQQLSKSGRERVSRQEIKEKVLKHSSVGGDVSKSKRRRGHDRDHSKSSKKARNMGISCNEEDRTSDHGLIMRKEKNSNSTGLLEETQKGHNEALLNVSAYNTAGKFGFMVDQAPASTNNDFVEVGAPDEGEFIAKRRKRKESQSYPTSLSSLPGGGCHPDKNGVLVGEKECSERKIQLINSEGKESSRSNKRSDEENDRNKNQQSNVKLGSTGVGSMKMECRLEKPPIPATSSSSKASSSLKSKASFHDMRSSPAESVSSLPMRSSKPDNVNLARQTVSEKHDFEGAAIIPSDSPRICSSHEVVGQSDQSRCDGKDEASCAAPNGSLESSILDPDKDNLSGNSDKAKVDPSPDISNRPYLHSGENNFGHDTQCPTRPLDSDKFAAEERKNEKNSGSNNLNTRESEKVSSSRVKDKYRKSQPERGPRDVRSNQENTYINGREAERMHVGKKDSAGKPGLNSKRKSQSNPEDARSSGDAVSTPNCDDSEISLKNMCSRKADQAEIVSGREKALALPVASTCQKEMPKDSSKPASRSQSTIDVESLPVSLSSGDDALKVPRQIKKADHQNGNQQKISRHFTSNGHRVRDINAPSPARRDSASHAAVNALKEAKDLKHLADRLKNGGSSTESIGLYFQAALKFLHGAALLESSNSEGSKRGDLVQSIQIYGSTAKLCEFCAHEYEKSKDMASAALAYKCMEVAYLKVVYSSHNNAGKDRQELQAALKMNPPGVSPSASDDNISNTAKMEKGGQSKDGSSPQVAGSQTIAASRRPNFVRLLNFAQDVNGAMEASRKSRIAFSAASSGDPKFKEALPSIKTALDYNFQDVEGLLRLVRLATEAISR